MNVDLCRNKADKSAVAFQLCPDLKWILSWALAAISGKYAKCRAKKPVKTEYSYERALCNERVSVCILMALVELGPLEVSLFAS